ncbi:hypothetical protein ABPG72_001190 [Tetrahymena utriculariae]
MSQLNQSQSKQANKEYSTLRCIGQGTFCKVFEGIDNKKQPVAIKIINKQHVQKLNEQSKQMIDQEIKVMKQLQKHNCDHILKYINSFEDSQNIYIITELCKQDTLFDKLQSQNNFSENEALYYFFQIKDAIYWMHYSKIAHRDIKLPNILFGLDNKIKLADFGFSKQSLEESEYASVLGTMTTVAPEVLLNKGYTQKADIFSLGQILSKMLFGAYLFVLQDFIQKFQYLQEFIDQNLTSQCQKFQISDQTKDLLKNMLRVDPIERIDILKIIERYPLGCYKQIVYLPVQQQNIQNIQLSKKQQNQQQVRQTIRQNSFQIFDTKGSFNSKMQTPKGISQSQNSYEQTQNYQSKQQLEKQEQRSQVIQNTTTNQQKFQFETPSFGQNQSFQTKNQQLDTIKNKSKGNSQIYESTKTASVKLQNKLKCTKVTSIQKKPTLFFQNYEGNENSITTKQADQSKNSMNKPLKVTQAKIQKLDDDQFKKQNQICQLRQKEKEAFSNLISYLEQIEYIQNGIKKESENKEYQNQYQLKQFLNNYVCFLLGLQISHLEKIQENKHQINEEFKDIIKNDFYQQQKSKQDKHLKELCKKSQTINLKMLDQQIQQELQNFLKKDLQKQHKILQFINSLQSKINDYESKKKYQVINLEE